MLTKKKDIVIASLVKKKPEHSKIKHLRPSKLDFSAITYMS